MSTINNPYSDLVSLMREQGAINNPPGLTLGTVKSINPLIIAVNGLELNDSFIKVSETLRPHSREVNLRGHYNITLSNIYTPIISRYDMPNKTIGLRVTSTANSTVSGGDGVSVFTSVTSNVNGDSHTHGSHNHTASSLTSVVGNGAFKGTIEYTDWAIKPGDTVVVLSSNDKQSYVVIAKI